MYVQMDNEDVGKPVSEYFGITGEAPKVIFPYVLFLFRSYKFSLSLSSRIEIIVRTFSHTMELIYLLVFNSI